jgi:hypothetical protein
MKPQTTSFTLRAAEPRRQHSPSGGSALRVVMVLGVLVISVLGFTSACGDSGPPAEECKGGVIRNGVCEGKCDPATCLAENTCVDNRCVLKCDAHTDCYLDGSQTCAPATEDDTGAAITTCQPNTLPRGMGIKCPFGSECDAVGICPDGKGCERAQCGNQPDACVRDNEACGDDSTCLIGKCPDTSYCTVNPCSAAECKPLSCLTKGEGDADAYCTRHDCAGDQDCTAGFYCGITRDPHELCGSDPQKGDNAFCGSTSEPCIDASALGQGNTLFEGSRCILRKSCIKRDQCSPCATDLDCSLFDTQRCLQVGGEGRCARACATDKDCDPDYMCSPEAACVPRFGACKGTGKFCEPCKNDEDCGDKDTKNACIEASGNQRACFDYGWWDATCDPAIGCVECMVDADCPAAKSGRKGECLEEGDGVGPGAANYRRCYLPFDAPDNKFGCW